jgi:hypothetical protein
MGDASEKDDDREMNFDAGNEAREAYSGILTAAMTTPSGILVVIALTTCQLFSQTTTGELAGRILGPHDERITGVNVVCSSPNLMGLRGATSDNAGRFHVGSLPPGQYNIKISHVSYQGIEITNISILLGKTTSLGPLHLAERTVESGEIAVTAARSPVDLTSSQGAPATAFICQPLRRSNKHRRCLRSREQVLC